MIEKVTGSSKNVALLAPIPLVHLWSAWETYKEGEACFGSEREDVFNNLEKIRQGRPVDVFIVATHPSAGSEEQRQELHWRATYLRYLSIGPDSQKLPRPPSTATDSAFVLYWLLEKLHPIADSEWPQPANIRSHGSDKVYRGSFPPRRPLLIQHPEQ